MVTRLKADSIPNQHTQIQGSMRGFEIIQTAERAVVLTVTATGTDAVPLRLRDAGLTVQVACAGAPLQVKPTVPDRPARGVMLRL